MEERILDLNAMEQYWVWLSSVEGVGPKHFYQLLTAFEDPRAVWDAAKMGMVTSLGPKTLGALKNACTKEYFYGLFEELEKKQILPVPRISKRYSSLLDSVIDPPPTLYVRGNADLQLENPFAIVGTRAPTRDGRRASGEFAQRLAKCGATVVSGLARGVDTCAHEGALAGGGCTVAVLGCGADIVYPPENAGLVERILASGGSILSEYRPGTQPLAQYFPARNRIISGLSRGVLLVEGGLKSGGLITVGYAEDQGRDLFAIPGSIYSESSKGPNMLLSNGAVPAVSEWDIPEYYRWGERPSQRAVTNPKAELTDTEMRIVEPLRSEEMTAGELAARTGIGIAQLNSVLTMLELRGIIWKVPGGAYRADA